MRTYSYLTQKPDIYCCISSNSDRRGLYAEIQFIFATVYSYVEHINTSVVFRTAEACNIPYFLLSRRLYHDKIYLAIIKDKYLFCKNLIYATCFCKITKVYSIQNFSFLSPCINQHEEDR